MQTLHIFNPEHDIALALNRSHLTMPHAAQELRMNLGWLPALWANDCDCILVDDVEFAIKAANRHKSKCHDVLFVSKEALKDLFFERVMPWGWDRNLCTELIESGISSELLPSEEILSAIRLLSNRRQTTHALQMLRCNIEQETCGVSEYLTSMERIQKHIASRHSCVLKAPWSSSGRGVRYVMGEMSTSILGWVHRIVHTQGGIMLEPYYNKVKDFAMEFEAHQDGSVTYSGLSVFMTENGAYKGSLLADEDDKQMELQKYLSSDLIEKVKTNACAYFSHLMKGTYVGPFGVDMMVVASPDANGFLMHPCVEINVRRTMGHVALSLTTEKGMPKQLMKIEHDVNYILKTSKLENNYVQTL